MIYRLLGMAAWNGAKWYLGRRYGSKASAKAPAKAIALGGALAVGAGVVALLARRAGADS